MLKIIKLNVEIPTGCVDFGIYIIVFDLICFWRFKTFNQLEKSNY